jgi:hypothetical protein
MTYMQSNHSDWVQAITWFAWGDIMENGGMVDLNGNKKPQYNAFMDTLRNMKVEESPYILTTTTTLNVRQADYSQYAQVGRVDGGAEITVLDPPALAKAKLADKGTDQWICVKNPKGGQAWVAAWLMEVAQESPMTIRRKGGGFINLRSGDMSQLGLVGQVNPGDKLIPLESPSIAFEKIKLSNGNDTPDNLKNWIYCETQFGQRVWVAAWFMTPHTESKIPQPIAGSSESQPQAATAQAVEVTAEAQAVAVKLLTADQLTSILADEVKKYAEDTGVQGLKLFLLTDDMHNTYAVNAIALGGATVSVLAQVVGDKISIEADSKDSLANSLQSRGVPSEQIVLSYKGE